MNGRFHILPDLDAAARRMPFDQFGRYHMLREAIDACRSLLPSGPLRILDVGGFFRLADGQPSLPLVGILPADTVTVVDRVECDLPGYVRGDGSALNWPDQTFDLVVSADTLEHIPRPRRHDFWHELLRVSRAGLLLAAPFGSPAVTLAEDLVFHYIKVELGGEQPQLKEHREYVLPRLDEWLPVLTAEGYPARAYPTGYVHAWLGMMLYKHLLIRLQADLATQQLPDTYYNLYVAPTERREPAYRHLVVVEKLPGIMAAVDAILAPTILPPADALDDLSAAWQQLVGPVTSAILQRQLVLATDRQRAVVHPDIDHLHTVIAQQKQLLNTVANDQRSLSQIGKRLMDSHDHASSAVHYEQAIMDLTIRSQWLEAQNSDLLRLIEALKNGRVMRLLTWLSNRRKP
ncbi:MAG: hypothetical protein NVSMB42_04530 [Herpetosiphon sp.]